MKEKIKKEEIGKEEKGGIPNKELVGTNKEKPEIEPNICTPNKVKL
jgi:hypothetical protein